LLAQKRSSNKPDFPCAPDRGQHGEAARTIVCEVKARKNGNGFTTLETWLADYAARIDVDIRTITAISASAAQRHTLRMHSNIFVKTDQLPFNAAAFSLARPAHDVSYQPMGRMTI
jgi:hypothetical protein